jgi:hypothetical protein
MSVADMSPAVVTALYRLETGPTDLYNYLIFWQAAFAYGVPGDEGRLKDAVVAWWISDGDLPPLRMLDWWESHGGALACPCPAAMDACLRALNELGATAPRSEWPRGEAL